MVPHFVSRLFMPSRIQLTIIIMTGIVGLVLLASCAVATPTATPTPSFPSPNDDLVLVPAAVFSGTVIPQDSWVIESVDSMEFKVPGILPESPDSSQESPPRVGITRMTDLSGYSDSAALLVPKTTFGLGDKGIGDLYGIGGFALSERQIPIFQPDDITIPDKPVDGVWRVSIHPSFVGEISSSGIISQPYSGPGETILEFGVPGDCLTCDFGDVCARIPGCCIILPVCTK